MISLIRPKRTAITLLEVIFAIGVIMIGLLGLLSIMPLAGRRAQDAVTFSTGAELGDSISKEIEIRRWLGNGRLVDIFPTARSVVYNPILRQMQTGGSTVAVNGICIDPLYIASQPAIPARTAFSSYDNSLFPYYTVNHDPLLDPSDTNSDNWPTTIPRMRRVGVAGMSAELARTIMENVNDLVVDQPNDRSLPARLTGLAVGTTSYGRRVPSGEFSWLATVVPTVNPGFANLSVAILRKRVVDVDFPTTVATAGSPYEADDNGNNERVAYVTEASGFSGGSGGTVHLVASNVTSLKLAPNDWIMLSKQVGVRDEHRWYRIVAIDAEPEILIPESDTFLEPSLVNLPSPSGVARTSEVWRRRITLDGPDWSFNFQDSSGTAITTGDASFADNTYATLVEGVVSVSEKVVPFTDL